MNGTVYLVGAGPGDPGLLTRRAAALLRSADVVVFDALVSEEIMALLPASARRIHVGKRSGARSTPQTDINALLIKEAQRVATVVRLKGGDPFVFGRGGEEAQAMARAGVPFEVVPGITAGLAAAAYAGIPATQRGVASSVTLVTGHDADDGQAAAARWRALAQLGGTIVIYMATQSIADITAALIDGGMAPETPAAAIESATTPRQRTVMAALDTIAFEMQSEGVAAPAVVVIGAAVTLRREIQWWSEQSWLTPA